MVCGEHISNRPSADFAIHYSTLRVAKDQPDVVSAIPCILLLIVCNWPIPITIILFNEDITVLQVFNYVFGQTECVMTDVSVLMQALLVTMHTPPLVKEFYPWNEIRNFIFKIWKLHIYNLITACNYKTWVLCNRIRSQK